MVVRGDRQILWGRRWVAHHGRVQERALRTTRTPPLLRADLVVGDAEQPGTEGVIAVGEAGEPLHRIGEDLLSGVGRIVPVAEAIEAVPQEIVTIALVEGSKCATVKPGGGHQSGVTPRRVW